MQTQNRIFDDLAKVASSAVNTLGGIREEVEIRVKERIERLANEMDLVPREEFDAMVTLARNATDEAAQLKQRLDELEARVAVLETKGKRTGARKAAGTAKPGGSAS